MHAVPEQLFDVAALKAIVFDLDGTLYRQDGLRRAMLLRLVRGHAFRPMAGLRTMRVLGAYRKAQEHLRRAATGAAAPIDLAAAQLRLACEWTNAEPDMIAECVNRWMEAAPLTLLARHLQPGCLEFLRACQARHLRMAVLSDYPAEAKLKALGLDGLFDVVLTAQSTEVGVFKPHPRGLLLALDKLGVRPAEAIYIGDRPDVDAVAAEAAGVACVILSKHIGFPQLREMLVQQPHGSAMLTPQPSLHRR